MPIPFPRNADGLEKNSAASGAASRGGRRQKADAVHFAAHHAITRDSRRSQLTNNDDDIGVFLVHLSCLTSVTTNSLDVIVSPRMFPRV
jgi:hypothetical protein